MSPRAIQHAVVLGAGVAGTLAAAAVAPFAERVTLIERDAIGAAPGLDGSASGAVDTAEAGEATGSTEPAATGEPAESARTFGDGAGRADRKGIPQARHAHMLLSSGARALDRVLPGAQDALLAAGARRVGLPGDVLVLSPQGWFPRFGDAQYFISCSRGLTDHVLHDRLLAVHRAVHIEGGAEVVAFTGDATRVTGVTLRERGSGGTTRTVDADLVVDATGRAGGAANRLLDLGVELPDEIVVDAGFAYATRVFAAPHGAGPAPAVHIQPHAGVEGRGGVLLPIEGGRWMVTLSGAGGVTPPGDAEGFVRFAKELRDPTLAELIARAHPLGPVRGYRHMTNRRRPVRRLAAWPRGFALVGDALCTFNPAYGQGMSVAAFAAEALRDALRTGAETVARQRAIAGAADPAWEMALAQDTQYDPAFRPGRVDAARTAFLDRVLRAATVHPSVTGAFIDVMTMNAAPTKLFAPKILAATFRRIREPALREAPFTAAERTALLTPLGLSEDEPRDAGDRTTPDAAEGTTADPAGPGR